MSVADPPGDAADPPEPTVPCPDCGGPMRFTGLPDVAGPVYHRVFRCRHHGYVRLPVEGERPDGWG